MQQQLTNSILMRFLKSKHINSGFVDRLKLHYRPLICPYISLIRKVSAGDKVGDLGCGSGQFLLLLSEFASPSELYGIEISDKLIDNGHQLLGFLEDKGMLQLEKYDGSHFPARLGELDIIFLIDVLHHIPAPQQETFLLNLAAIMKPGARLVIKDIDAANPLVIFNKMHDLVVSHEIGHELRIEKVSGSLQKGGLDIVEIEKCTTYVYPHYTITAKKP
jgi:SAM-dependent methyltransferase